MMVYWGSEVVNPVVSLLSALCDVSDLSMKTCEIYNIECFYERIFAIIYMFMELAIQFIGKYQSYVKVYIAHTVCFWIYKSYLVHN